MTLSTYLRVRVYSHAIMYKERYKISKMAKLIELKGISKSYDGEKVIDSMNLYIRDK